MTDYYKEKKRANSRVDELYSDGVPKEFIYFKIATEFGFSKKIVDERINQLEKVMELKKKPIMDGLHEIDGKAQDI